MGSGPPTAGSAAALQKGSEAGGPAVIWRCRAFPTHPSRERGGTRTYRRGPRLAFHTRASNGTRSLPLPPSGPAPDARARAARGALWAARPTEPPGTSPGYGAELPLSSRHRLRAAAAPCYIRPAPSLQLFETSRADRGTRNRGQLWVSSCSSKI